MPTARDEPSRAGSVREGPQVPHSAHVQQQLNQLHLQMPCTALRSAAWPGICGRGYPTPFGQPGMGMEGLVGWGVPPVGGFAGTFANPYGNAFGVVGGGPMDPMMAWFAMHYGQYAHALQSAATMRSQQRQQNGPETEAAEVGRSEDGSWVERAKENLRWWQDPEKVRVGSESQVVTVLVPKRSAFVDLER